MSVVVSNSLFLSAVLFTIGVLGVMIRRHPVIIFMCIELMLNAANLALVAFNDYHYSKAWPALDGQVYAFMVIAIAAAEVAVGLAIIVALFKRRERVDVDEINLLRG
ncbi:NADH-quinone oxidoreductase subunit NuoK [bacterium]|nr:NADH-quinone oxidoreductase subunit NuoK [bacterium]